MLQRLRPKLLLQMEPHRDGLEVDLREGFCLSGRPAVDLVFCCVFSVGFWRFFFGRFLEVNSVRGFDSCLVIKEVNIPSGNLT